MQFYNDLLIRTRSTGLLIDSNLLLLLAVGDYDKALIQRFDRTAKLLPSDYDILIRLLEFYPTVLTTPNIVTEVSNLSNRIRDNVSGKLRHNILAKLRSRFAIRIGVVEEHYVGSHAAATNTYYPKLGITDAGILFLAAACKCLVLTDDLDLAQIAGHLGIDVLNFTHLQQAAWGF